MRVAWLLFQRFGEALNPGPGEAMQATAAIQTINVTSYGTSHELVMSSPADFILVQEHTMGGDKARAMEGL
eukprot:9127232-Alexandrium_andersonii.AAC.1